MVMTAGAAIVRMCRVMESLVRSFTGQHRKAGANARYCLTKPARKNPTSHAALPNPARQRCLTRTQPIAAGSRSAVFFPPAQLVFKVAGEALGVVEGEAAEQADLQHFGVAGHVELDPVAAVEFAQRLLDGLAGENNLPMGPRMLDRRVDSACDQRRPAFDDGFLSGK